MNTFSIDSQVRVIGNRRPTLRGLVGRVTSIQVDPKGQTLYRVAFPHREGRFLFPAKELERSS